MVEFPDAPAINEIYTANAKVWVWTGYAWKQSVQSLRGVSPSTQPGREVQVSVGPGDYQSTLPSSTSFI